MQRIALVCCLALVACTTVEPAAAPGPNPLGPALPHAEAIIRGIIRATEAQDWNAYCRHIAIVGEDGKPAALVPGKNAPAKPPEAVWQPADDFTGLGHFLSSPGKEVRFGPATSVTRKGAITAVPVRVVWDFAKMTESEKRMVCAAASARSGERVSWEDAARPLRTRMEMEASGLIQPQRLHFAEVDGSWRLWLGPALDAR